MCGLPADVQRVAAELFGLLGKPHLAIAASFGGLLDRISPSSPYLRKEVRHCHGNRGV